MKKCSKCEIEKLFSEFSKDLKGKYGLSSKCKSCHKQYREENKEKRKQYLKKNKEKIAEQNKKYREANKERIAEREKQYKEANKERISEREKKYREVNKEKRSENFKKWYEANKEIIAKYRKQYNKQYYKENKERIVERTKQYFEENKEKIAEYKKQYKKQRLQTDPIFKFKCNVRSLIIRSFKRGSNQFRKDAKTEQILGCTIEEFRSYIESKFTEGMSFENHGEWHLDHITPIAIANTEEEIIKLNHYTNFQPLWAEENIRKGNRLDY